MSKTKLAQSRDYWPCRWETWTGRKFNFRLPSPPRKRLVLKFPNDWVAITDKRLWLWWFQELSAHVKTAGTAFNELQFFFFHILEYLRVFISKYWKTRILVNIVILTPDLTKLKLLVLLCIPCVLPKVQLGRISNIRQEHCKGCCCRPLGREVRRMYLHTHLPHTQFPQASEVCFIPTVSNKITQWTKIDNINTNGQSWTTSAHVQRRERSGI